MDRRSFGAAVASLLASCGFTRAANKKPSPVLDTLGLRYVTDCPKPHALTLLIRLGAVNVRGQWRWGQIVDEHEYDTMRSKSDATACYKRWLPDFDADRLFAERRPRPFVDHVPSPLELGVFLLWQEHAFHKHINRPLTATELTKFGLS